MPSTTLHRSSPTGTGGPGSPAVAAVMDSLGLRAAHVVGWLYGGNEAVLLATQHPDRVLSVI